MTDDVAIWDKVRLVALNVEAQVTSVFHDPTGDSFICKWTVDGVLHMATFERSEVACQDA